LEYGKFVQKNSRVPRQNKRRPEEDFFENPGVGGMSDAHKDKHRKRRVQKALEYRKFLQKNSRVRAEKRALARRGSTEKLPITPYFFSFYELLPVDALNGAAAARRGLGRIPLRRAKRAVP
jgi:hypothetical protein